MDDPKQELEQLRRRMDEVNDRLVDALGEFYVIADAIGAVKDRMGVPHQDLAREAEMKTRVLLRNRGPVSAAALSELFNHILRLSVVRMDEGGRSRLTVGRSRGAPDRVVALGGLVLGGPEPVLGTEGDGRLVLTSLDGALAAEAVDLVHADGVGTGAHPALRIRGARMYDYRLLSAAGAGTRPVLLERNPGATVEEWLHAAEYIAAEGNQAVALCEAGSLSFSARERPLLDLSAVALARSASVLPVLAHLGAVLPVDRPAMAAAAGAAGACGVVLPADGGAEREAVVAALRGELTSRAAGSPGP